MEQELPTEDVGVLSGQLCRWMLWMTSNASSGLRFKESATRGSGALVIPRTERSIEDVDMMVDYKRSKQNS